MNDKKNYSFELQEVLSYMIDVLVNEFPTEIFTPEYLIVSILDVKKCHANMFLDNYLMSNNIEELREIYTSVLNGNNKPIISNDRKEKVEFDFELNKIMEKAELEADILNSKFVGTEHVLLSILNPKNEIKIQEVFRTVGIEYDLIFDKCKDNKKSPRTNRKANFINNNGPQQKQQIIPLKSEVNASSVVSAGEYISKFTTNINQLAKDGKIDELIGREKELSKIIKVLARRKKNNVVLVGEGGVGKTEIIKGLAQKIVNGEVPAILEGKEIVEVNVMALVSGTHFRGMFEERVKGLFDELKASNKYILFIDDMSSVLKSSNKDKDTDISNMIGDILSEGDVRVIGTTSFKDYRNSIENNPGVSNKLQRIVIEPSTVSETIEILKNNKKYYEEFHNVSYTDESIKKCAELSERYITDRKLPDSAFDVLDLTGAYISLANSESNEFSDLKKRLNEIEDEKNIILNNGDFEKIDAITIEENDIKKRINDFKRKEKAEKKEKIKVYSNDVSKTISEITNIPISKLSTNEKERILHIDDKLKESVIGQDEAIESLCKIIKRNKIGLGDKNSCVGAFLFGGKTGTGKTLLAKKIAEEIFGDEKALIRIDMSEYSEKSSIAKLHGCFTPEMNVLMADGSYKKISDVEIGDYVITHNGNIKKVENKFEYYIEEEINNLYPSNTNFKIRCTKGHNILSIKPYRYSNGRIHKKTYSSKNAKFIESDKIDVGDVLMYPKNINVSEKRKVFDLTKYLNENGKYTFDDKYIYSTKNINRNIEFDENLARILGYYVSEGSITKSYKEIYFTFNINETDYVNEVIDLMKKVFNLNLSRIDTKEKRHAISVHFHSRIVCKFISELCGRECHSKHLPSEIFEANKNVKINLLETALFGDGTKCMVKQTKYTTVSIKLASQVNSLFRSLGYSTQFVKEEHENKNWNTTYRIILTGKNVEKLNNEFPNLRIKSYGVKPKNIQRKYFMDDEYYYYRLNKKEKEFYCGLVYDLTIEDDSSYIVNGISVHNSSPGYVGYEDGGVLTTAIKNKPYSVVLLDEIEKADESIFNLFLQIFDEGRITESNGNVINCKNCLFIMTSNIGAKQASEFGGGVGFVTDEAANKKTIIEKQLKQKFTPEFLNRIDKIVYFNTLTDDNLKEIVKLEINKFGKRLKEIKYNIEYDDSVVSYIHQEAIKQKEYGARPIIRLVQNNLEDKITDMILENEYEPEYAFTATCVNNNIEIK